MGAVVDAITDGVNTLNERALDAGLSFRAGAYRRGGTGWYLVSMAPDSKLVSGPMRGPEAIAALRFAADCLATEGPRLVLEDPKTAGQRR